MPPEAIADPLPESAVLDRLSEADRRKLVNTMPPTAWPLAVEMVERDGFAFLGYENFAPIVIGDFAAFQAINTLRRTPEELLGTIPTSAPDREEHAASLHRQNGNHREARRLMTRSRIGRVRMVLGRALTPPLRARSREHRSPRSRARSSSRSSRGDPDPDGDPESDCPEPPGHRTGDEAA